jgi:hypothetical protein
MMKDYIDSFERLAVRTENLIHEFFKQYFISGLKEEI